MTDLREQKWIVAAREGDQGAFEELVRLYENRVLALTQRMCKNPEDAAEAAQEAFFAAWRGLKNFRGDSSFSACSIISRIISSQVCSLCTSPAI